MSIKKLAGQTMWYGVSSIAARFINYLLTPFLTYSAAVGTANYGRMSLIYSAIPLLNVLFTYGFETAYFRFSAKEENKKTIYSTASLSLLFSTSVFTFLLWANQESFASIVGLADLPRIVQISIFIIAFDTLAAMPFARLRQEGRPVKYAVVRIGGILINILFTWFFIGYCPQAIANNPDSWVKAVYNPQTNAIVYVVLANLLQSVFTLLLLSRELLAINMKFDSRLWKQMMLYSMPLVIAGMGGMINETFDRLMLNWWLPGDATYKAQQIGIYGACYKLSILITLFIQAFRMGAEPFFFKQAEGQNPQRTYARVMKFFVITICVMFLVVALFLPVWKRFIGPDYWSGLKVVPILLFANMFLGIYYNLSVWYKLGNKTMAGAWITLMGAAITIAINTLLIPHFSYVACAWATFTCYGTMMVVSYVWGQKEYRIPYAWKKLVAYMVIVVMLFGLQAGITHFYSPNWFVLLLGALLLFVFVRFLLLVEQKEFRKIAAALPALPFLKKKAAR